MTHGIELTFQHLGKTRNTAATGLLIAALDSPVSDIHDAAIEALLRRRDAAGQRALFQRWTTLSQRNKDKIAGHIDALDVALREALNASEETEFQTACEAIIRCREYETVPLLLRMATETGNPRRETATHTLVQLVGLLRQELDRTDKRSGRHSPEFIRAHTIEALEGAVRQYRDHENHQVLEAFLILISRENPLFRELMQSPDLPTHLAIVEILRHSTHPAVVGLILSCLEDASPMAPLLHLIGVRYDGAFLSQWFRKLPNHIPGPVKQNLRKLHRLAWAEENRKVLTKLSGPQQGVALRILAQTSVSDPVRYETLKLIATEGQPEGRLEAIQQFVTYTDANTTALVLHATDDDYASIRASALRQVRARQIPGAIKLLLEHLEGESPLVQEAVRESLADFNFPAYLAAFDKMNEPTRVKTGGLVAKVDVRTPQYLEEELRGEATFRQLRACSIIRLLHLEPMLEGVLHDLLVEGDQAVRVEAAEMLSRCPTEATRQALREAVLDRNVRVREMAEESLRRVAGTQPSAPENSSPANDLSLRS